MKLFLHCGFPKTGTTALQKWLTTNSDFLKCNGINYPAELRDEEGIAHHVLAKMMSLGVPAAVDQLAIACRSSPLQSTLISTESLTNFLGSDRQLDQQLLESLLDGLSVRSVDTTLLITLRAINTQLRSIIIQNVLYDRAYFNPVSLASFGMGFLVRAYSFILALLPKYNLKIFNYSQDVNYQIVRYLVGENKNIPSYSSVRKKEHVSPGVNQLLLFFWLNKHKIVMSPDFHSFLRFGDGSQKIINDGAKLLLTSMSPATQYAAEWTPSKDFICAAYDFHVFVAHNFFGDQLRFQSSSARSAFEMVRDRVLQDLQLIYSDDVRNLNYVFDAVNLKSADAILGEMLDKLIKVGSIEFNQDFSITTVMPPLVDRV
jgi:hypothetical protein